MGSASVIYFCQILEMNPEEDAEEDGANIDLDSQRKGKCVVLKTSTRQVSEHIPTHLYVLIPIPSRLFVQ